MEIFTFGIFAGLIIGIIFILGGTLIAKHNDNNKDDNKTLLHRNNSNDVYINRDNCISNNNMGNNYKKINNRQNIQSTQCYENGEITNICAIIALKNIKREMKNVLSNIEKDAIDKSINSIISMEKLDNFINNENSIDIEEYI